MALNCPPLSGALRRQFDHTEWLPDLAEAVSIARDAVDAVPPDHPDRPMLLANLAGALGTRFSHTEELADLDMAIALEHEAVEAIYLGMRIAFSVTRYRYMNFLRPPVPAALR